MESFDWTSCRISVCSNLLGYLKALALPSILPENNKARWLSAFYNIWHRWCPRKKLPLFFPLLDVHTYKRTLGCIYIIPIHNTRNSLLTIFDKKWRSLKLNSIRPRFRLENEWTTIGVDSFIFSLLTLLCMFVLKTSYEPTNVSFIMVVYYRTWYKISSHEVYIQAQFLLCNCNSRYNLGFKKI